MKVTQILNVISAANQLTPEQTQILEKGLRKLDADRSTDEIIEYLRENGYPLIEDHRQPRLPEKECRMSSVGMSAPTGN